MNINANFTNDFSKTLIWEELKIIFTKICKLMFICDNIHVVVVSETLEKHVIFQD